MTVGTGNFAELLWPGIADIWQNKYGEYQPIWNKVFSVKNSDKAFEKAQGIVNLPLAAVKDQGSPIAYFDPMQGYQKEFVNLTYAIGSSVTREMFEDDQYNVINSIPAMIARSMRQTEEVVHHAQFNNGFSSALTADGVSIFNVSHPMVDSTVAAQSNIGQSGVTYQLSQTTLEQALIFIGRWTDDRGLRINVMAKTLFVPTELQFTADKILKTEYEVNTANNTINPIKGRLKPVVSPFLTDTDAWFILTDVTESQNDGFVSYQRRKAEMERDNEFTTQNLSFQGSMRFSVGCTDWRGGWGSSGA